MPELSGSWGLMLDLGDEVAEQDLQTLYSGIWQNRAFSGPSHSFGEFRGLPRASEGALNPGADLAGKCYTKFELDDLGYPPGWLVPVTFSLSVYGFETVLPQNQALYAFLLALAEEFGRVPGFRMGIIGELSCYYLNAEFLGPDWIDLHQQSVLALILPRQHPFARSHPGQPLGEMYVYQREQLQAFWSPEDEGTRYARFKQRLSEALHSPLQQNLDWESPSQN